MFDLIFSLVTFVLIYLFYVFFVILRKKKLEKFKQNTYVKFLVTKYNLDLKKINFKILAHAIALTNAFIISAALFVISFIDNWLYKIGIAFVILVPLQFIMYALLGKLFEKKGSK